jgi:hypothetical protein
MQRELSRTYLARAKECRQLAQIGLPGLEKQFLELAATYEVLAEQTRTLEVTAAQMKPGEG